MSAPAPSPGNRIFISYSHDSESHKNRVWELVKKLQRAGFDCRLDQFLAAPPEGWPSWCQKNIQEARFVLMIWTETYRRRLEQDEREENGRGVRFEGSLMINDVFDHASKYISVGFYPNDLRYAQLAFQHSKFDLSKSDGFEHLLDHLRGLETDSEPWVQEYLQRLLETLRPIEKHYVPIGVEPERFSAYRNLEDQEGSELGQALPLAEVSVERPHLVILGEPGSGKTWALQHLAIDMAARFRNRTSKETCIPIYAELKNWPPPYAHPNPPATRADFLRYLREEVNQMLNPDPRAEVLWKISLDSLKRPLNRTPFLFILDGLDEIRDPWKRLEFVKACADFGSEDGGIFHRVIIGSRKYGFVKELRLFLRGFTVFEMTKLTPHLKLEIIKNYKKADVPPDEILDRIHRHYRLAGLSDNVLLLRILAEHYATDRELATTRGRILHIHIEETLAYENFLEHSATAEQAKVFLTLLAAEKRRLKAATLEEDGEVIESLIGLELGLDAVSRHRFLEHLLNTRLIKRQSGKASARISFALPQYEEYFLAQPVVKALEAILAQSSSTNRTLSSAGRSRRVRESKYVGDREWHHVLILAAGQLSSSEVGQVAEALGSEEFLFLKARILGEADADVADRDFRKSLRERIDHALDGALKRISRWAIAILLLWWALLLPVTFFVYAAYFTRPWTAVFLYLGYAVGVPAAFPYVYRLVRLRYQRGIQLELLRLLAALSCLRTGAVSDELKKILSQLEKHRPHAASGEDLFVQFLDFAEEQIDLCADLAKQDLETLDADLVENPYLIEQYLKIPAEAFSEVYLDIFRRVLEPDAKLVEECRKHQIPLDTWQMKCVHKLWEVATVSTYLREHIIDLLNAIAHERPLPRIADAIQQVMESIRQGTPPAIPRRRGVVWMVLIGILYLASGWRHPARVTLSLTLKPIQASTIIWGIACFMLSAFIYLRDLKPSLSTGRRKLGIRILHCLYDFILWLILCMVLARLMHVLSPSGRT